MVYHWCCNGASLLQDFTGIHKDFFSYFYEKRVIVLLGWRVPEIPLIRKPSPSIWSCFSVSVFIQTGT